MSESESGLSKLIQELRNRRVFRVAAVYMGVGYAVLESSSIIIPMLGFSETIVKIILAVLVLGFPVALGLAWMFQLTPDGLRRSPKSGEKQTSDEKPLTSNGAIVVLLVIITVLLSYQSFSGGVSDQTHAMSHAGLDPKSVAVLPFTPFTKTVEDESFADGVHDDILTQLSKVAELKVISRTSVMQYKGTTHKISDIASELGVANVLEGSVRRAGDQIRIVAQLINAKTDEHLWAETYDREYADIFAIQSDVAKKIAKALKAQLTPKEQQYIETKPTENQEAWELYTRAELLAGSTSSRPDSVISLYEQAADLDPKFLLPVTRLVRNHAHAYFDGNGRDPSSERLEKASVLLEVATSLDPDAPETHLANGYFYYYGSRDYQNALNEFYIAHEAQPNNSDLFAAIAYVERRLGRWEAALSNIEKAVSLDPNNGEKVHEAEMTAAQMREWSKSQRYGNHHSAILGGNTYRVEVKRYWASQDIYGEIEKLQPIYDELLSRFDGGEMVVLKQWHAFFRRDYKHGLELNQANPVGGPYNAAEWLRLNGNHEDAATYYDSARIEAETRIAENPENWSAFGSLGLALARLKKYEEAMESGRKGVDKMPLSRDALLGPRALETLALIYTFCGEQELAINTLEHLLSIPSWVNFGDLKILPWYDPLRENPRFQKLIRDNS